MIRHKLTNVDLINKKADCSNCGYVTIRVNKKQNNRNCYYAHKYGANNVPVRTNKNGCEICGDTDKIVFDHDHKTGKHRGWICTNCNIMLGYAKDNPAVLIAGAKYLS